MEKQQIDFWIKKWDMNCKMWVLGDKNLRDFNF